MDDLKATIVWGKRSAENEAHCAKGKVNERGGCHEPLGYVYLAAPELPDAVPDEDGVVEIPPDIPLDPKFRPLDSFRLKDGIWQIRPKADWARRNLGVRDRTIEVVPSANDLLPPVRIRCPQCRSVNLWGGEFQRYRRGARWK